MRKFHFSRSLMAVAGASVAVVALASMPAMALDYSKTVYDVKPNMYEDGPGLMMVSMRPKEDKITVRYKNRGEEGIKMITFYATVSTDGKPVNPEEILDGGTVLPYPYGRRFISAPLPRRPHWFTTEVYEFDRTSMDQGVYLSSDGLAEGAGYLYLAATFVYTNGGMAAGAWATEIDYRDCLLAPSMTECRAVVVDDGSGVVKYVPFDDEGNDLSYEVREAKLRQEMAALTGENERLAAELEAERNKPAETVEVVREVEVPVEVPVPVPVEVPVEVVREVEKEVVVTKEKPVEKIVERRVISESEPAVKSDTMQQQIARLEQEKARLTEELNRAKAENEQLLINGSTVNKTEVPETLGECSRDDKTMYWWAIVVLSIGLLGLLTWWFLPVPIRRKKHEQE